MIHDPVDCYYSIYSASFGSSSTQENSAYVRHSWSSSSAAAPTWMESYGEASHVHFNIAKRGAIVQDNSIYQGGWDQFQGITRGCLWLCGQTFQIPQKRTPKAVVISYSPQRQVRPPKQHEAALMWAGLTGRRTLNGYYK